MRFSRRFFSRFTQQKAHTKTDYCFRVREHCFTFVGTQFTSQFRTSMHAIVVTSCLQIFVSISVAKIKLHPMTSLLMNRSSFVPDKDQVWYSSCEWNGFWVHVLWKKAGIHFYSQSMMKMATTCF